MFRKLSTEEIVNLAHYNEGVDARWIGYTGKLRVTSDDCCFRLKTDPALPSSLIWFTFENAARSLTVDYPVKELLFNEGDLVYCSLINDTTTVNGTVVKTPLVVVGKSYLNNGWAYKLSSSNRVLYPENSLTKVCS